MNSGSKSNSKSLLKQIAVIIVLSIITNFFMCPDCFEGWQSWIKGGGYSLLIWVSLWMGNGYLVNLLDKRISWVKYPIWRLIIGLVTMTGYTTAIVYILILSFQYVYNVTWTTQNRISNIIVSLVITFIISLIMHARGFLLNWRKLELDAEKMKNEKLSSQYESLKNQVNPHFLFNSFNALTELIYHDQELAARFVKQLSIVYRYVLEHQDKEVVNLKEELDFVKSYLFLEKIRYSDNLIVKYEINENNNVQVPPLSLQMLVENAIKHNIISREEPLMITIKDEGEDYIVISNNLQKKSINKESSTGLGLKNIKARYEFLSNKLVHILEENGQFTVKLPFINFRAE